jgi:hypothetical protein
MAAPGSIDFARNLTTSSLADRREMVIFGLTPAEVSRVRRSFLSLAILLALPGAAHAEPTDVVRPEFKPAIETEVPAAAGPMLELGFDPALAVDEPAGPVMMHALPEPQVHDDAGRFSFGFDIKAPRQMGSPAARAAAVQPGPPTLADKLEGIVERSSIGVTGTYHF